MKIFKRIVTAAILSGIAFSVNAQVFNFSLRTTNQQLIDKAIEGAFVKIAQGYELCDTTTNEHFGRGGKDYFNVIPFLGIETERGLIMPLSVVTPWDADPDFVEYKATYKPLVTNTHLFVVNNANQTRRNIDKLTEVTKLTEFLNVFNDSTYKNEGLRVDTAAGDKDGWIVWVSTNDTKADSARFVSVRKDIQIPADGESVRMDTPEISETVLGGIYITPVQTAIGSLQFTLTGIMVYDNDGWVLEFPFIEKPRQDKVLTPIEGIKEMPKLNQLKKRHTK